MTYKKKLIEVALPLSAINEASHYDKALKHGHPDNLHQWWARRPLPAARAVLWASLVDDPSSNPDQFPSHAEQATERARLLGLLERLVRWESTDDAATLEEARREIARSCHGDMPRVVDPFGGGGAIPLESVRLGLETFTGDLNPVAVLLHRAGIEIPRRFTGAAPVNPEARHGMNVWDGAMGLAADVGYYGEMLRSIAEREVGYLYPAVTMPGGRTATAIAWIMARTVRSPDPAFPGHVPLVRSWVLSRKPRRPLLHVRPVVERGSGSIRYEIVEGGDIEEPTVERGRGRCLATGAPIPADYIKAEAAAGRMGTHLLAVVVEGNRRRDYLPGSTHAALLASVEQLVPPWVPEGSMSTHPQYMGSPRYGLDQWSKLFTTRQLLTHTALFDGLKTVHAAVMKDGSALGSDDLRFGEGGTGSRAYADAIVTYLAFSIDKLLDLNNALVTWKVDAECPVHVFGRQALPMSWDFVEANPFSDSSGSLRSALKSICGALSGRGYRQLMGSVETRQIVAEANVGLHGQVVISTDPPYYDNVPYSDLSDFFFVWLRKGLRDIWPDELATILTPKSDELVANHIRAGSWDAAQSHFEQGMRRFFRECAQYQDPRYPMTVFYAFKATEEAEQGIVSTGWETFLEGVLASGMTITATWPIRTESRSRLRGLGANALASSVVLACRPREVAAPMATRGEFVGALNRELESAVRVLQEQNIAPVDLAQAAMGPGIAIYSRYARVVEADGATMSVRAALGLINEVLAQVLSGEESEFDSDTRFAVTWFEQYGHNHGPFGDADLLARAKDTTVSGVVQAGLVLSREGRVRLVERSEMSHPWDPVADTRPTVWEMTQHLIRCLDSSEVEAAALLARLGPGHGERARQLAYLLYGICERRKWTEEASAYNMLVTAWPEIGRLAAAGPAAQSEDRLF